MAELDNTETRDKNHEWLEIARAARLAAGKDADKPLSALHFSDELSTLCYRLHGLVAAVGGLRPYAGDEKLRAGVCQLLEDTLAHAEALTEIYEAERQVAMTPAD